MAEALAEIAKGNETVEVFTDCHDTRLNQKVCNLSPTIGPRKDTGSISRRHLLRL